MRVALVAVLLLLAGCTESDASLLTKAESLREASVDDAQNDGDMSQMKGDMGIKMNFDGQAIEMDFDFTIDIHRGDAFTMDMTMDMMFDDSRDLAELVMQCTPEHVLVEMTVDGEPTRFEGDNDAGTCLDLESADMMSFMEPFKQLDGFQAMDLESFGLATNDEFPYDAARMDGSTLVAEYSGSTSIEGFSMDYDGEDRFKNDRLVSQSFEITADTFGMEMSAVVTFSYGERGAAPTI